MSLFLRRSIMAIKLLINCVYTMNADEAYILSIFGSVDGRLTMSPDEQEGSHVLTGVDETYGAMKEGGWSGGGGSVSPLDMTSAGGIKALELQFPSFPAIAEGVGTYEATLYLWSAGFTATFWGFSVTAEADGTFTITGLGATSASIASGLTEAPEAVAFVYDSGTGDRYIRYNDVNYAVGGMSASLADSLDATIFIEETGVTGTDIGKTVSIRLETGSENYLGSYESGTTDPCGTPIEFTGLDSVISGTRHWWPLDDSGTTAVDQVSALNFTMSGSYTRQQTPLNSHNSSTTLSGGQGIISDVPLWVYEGDRAMSMAFWMKHSGDFTITNQSVISDAVNSDSPLETDHQFWVEVTSSTIRVFWEHDFGNNKFTLFNFPVGFDITETHHYALARDTAAKTVTLYIDGEFVETIGYTNNPNGDNNPSKEWILGAYRLSGGGLDDQLSATLQDVLMFDKAINATEVSLLYNIGNGVDYNNVI